jgi:hypothetical protein
VSKKEIDYGGFFDATLGVEEGSEEVEEEE